MFKKLENIVDEVGAHERVAIPSPSHADFMVAMRRAEEEEDWERAYYIAKACDDKYKADKFAIKADIKDHEFSDFIFLPGEDFYAVYRRALSSKFNGGATAERLGFKGFKDKVTADIGCREGHFIEMFKSLGASEVYGIDPSEVAILEAVKTERLDNDHAFQDILQNVEHKLEEKIDRAAVLNFAVYEETENFCKSLYHILAEDGQAVFTFAEKEVLERYRPSLEKYFVLSISRSLGKEGNAPHAFLVIADKKPRLLIEE